MILESEACGDDGFTLIEVLVAFAILTLGLVAFFGSAGLSSRLRADSLVRSEALAHSQSHLAALGHSMPLEPGTSSGTYTGGISWRLGISELPGSTGTAVPRLVTLDAFDRSARLLTRLRTVKLASVRQ